MSIKAGRISRCSKLQAPAQGVFYKANPSYKGTDEVGYEVRSASGRVETHTVRSTVKDSSASDTKTTPEDATDL